MSQKNKPKPSGWLGVLVIAAILFGIAAVFFIWRTLAWRPEQGQKPRMARARSGQSRLPVIRPPLAVSTHGKKVRSFFGLMR